MKRLLAVLSLALLTALVVGAGVANATHSSGNEGPKKDFANGMGQVLTTTGTTTTDQQIHVNAERKASKAARGFIVEKTTETTGGTTTKTQYKARVTCIDADGDDAVVVGKIERVKAGTLTPGQYVQLFIHDGGEPGAGNDQVSRQFFAADAEPACTLPGSGLVTTTQGNYIVHAGLS